MVRKILNHSKGTGVKIAYVLLLLSAGTWLYGQSSPYSYFYRICFKDKGGTTISSFAPGDLLSVRALLRRQKAGIPVPDFRDIPVYRGYLNQLSASGLQLHCTSKWMNSGLFKTQTPADMKKILDLPFVKDVKMVKSAVKRNSLYDKLNFQIEKEELPPFDRPITMVNGYPLHNSGYEGKEILIAVLDGGFTIADQISSLKDLRGRNGIRATYDFVKNSRNVYSYSPHGTAVMSVLAGKIPWLIEGTAAGADYLLLRTEDTESESPCEEDFWAAGAEYADSIGADIISSSLGYYNFDDPSLNYKYSDLDGNSAYVTRVADIAASKGILVVNSAGNERTKTWKRIIFPADGDSVLAVGAVDGNNLISGFSSAGPSIDGRIKPDIVTMGVSVPVQTSINEVVRANGTSFSCPVLSGMAACLMQAVPQARMSDIIEALHSSADRYNSPDSSLYGYGIPDMVYALKILQDKYVKIPDGEIITGPNPTTGDIEIIFRQPPGSLTIEIITMSGEKIFRKDFNDYAGRTLHISELQKREQGVYFIRIIKSNGVNVQKIIKIRS